jgi:hypothetical protein
MDIMCPLVKRMDVASFFHEGKGCCYFCSLELFPYLHSIKSPRMTSKSL